MGKSKAQRKQEKKASMQEVKKEQEIKAKEKKQEIEKQPKEEITASKAPVKKPVGPEQVKLTMYTLVYMIATFVSGCVTVVAMVVYAKPISHVLKVTVGSTINDYSYEAVEQVLFEDYPDLPIYGLYLGVALLVAASAVVTVVGLIKAVNEFNKPSVITVVLGLVFSMAALILFIYTDDFTKSKIREMGIPESPEFGVYTLYLPLLITNIVGMVSNIFATIYGLNRWKKTGRTSK